MLAIYLTFKCNCCSIFLFAKSINPIKRGRRNLKVGKQGTAVDRTLLGLLALVRMAPGAPSIWPHEHPQYDPMSTLNATWL